MIRDWNEFQLNMDFSNIGVVCSDIDLIHITKNNRLIIGEIKNTRGVFKAGQRKLLAKIVDAYKGGGAVLFITHTGDVYSGDNTVNIAECPVEEYYWGGEWIIPYKHTTVEDAMKKLEDL